ncbi:uncharacterized protein [Ptychodera flava]|uniref:uncharacterized protein n=1 Tax=Ptychodera flava TaxID=63121 RepID=UPI003969C9AD
MVNPLLCLLLVFTVSFRLNAVAFEENRVSIEKELEKAEAEVNDLVDKDLTFDEHSKSLAAVLDSIQEKLDELERKSRNIEDDLAKRIELLSRERRDTCDCEQTIEDILSATYVNDYECYTAADGSDYRGNVSRTASGLVCQNWNSQTPHSHEITPADHSSSGIGDHNYCRNPDSASTPWCFTEVDVPRSQYCDVGAPSDECPREYITLTAVTFVIYGETSCPSGADLVYTGFIGSTMSTDEGGGVNYLCMPDNPIYNRVVNGVQDSRAYLYHTQYRNLIGGQALRELSSGDAPCGVCRVPNQSTVLMIPARNVCPDDSWTLQYSGYLVAQRVYIRHSRTEFICLSSNAVELVGTESYALGGSMYNVEGRCKKDSAMDNGNYVDGGELTCAVCTK